MNKFKQKSLLLIATASLLLLAWSITATISGSNGSPYSQIKVSTELESISQSDIEGIKEEVLLALNSIPRILEIKYRNTTEIKIIDKGICYANGNVISLSISHIRDNSAPIIHEVTHILTKHGYNSFFSEGLAVYFQERFGENKGFPNFSASLDELVRSNKDQLLSISQLNNNNEIFEQVGTERRRIAYIEAGSFINFLVEKYGEKKLADFHNFRTLDYQKIYGKKFKELEAEWKEYVLGASRVNV